MLGARNHRIALRSIVLAGIMVLLQWAGLRADLRTNPTWYDENGVGVAPDWHYRVPIRIHEDAEINSVIRVDVDFNTLLQAMGINGTFDVNSSRVVRNNGALCAVQQYTDAVFGQLTDTPDLPHRGEIRFVMEEGSSPDFFYYLYFDIVENGAKPVWPAANTLNGNFEFLDGSRVSPPGWTGYANVGANGQAGTIDAATVNVFSANGWPDNFDTEEDGDTGNRCYMMGVRDAAESSGGQQPLQTSTLTRTISLPQRRADRGELRIRYRIKGWDSSDNNQNRYDYLRIQLRRTNGVLIQELVGPDGPAYGTKPFSPNEGTGPGSSGNPGYGPYNGFSSGDPHAPPTDVEPWHEVVHDLTASGASRRNVVLHIETRNYNLYRSWFHIDNVQWSVLTASFDLDEVEAFGTDITVPAPANPVFFGGDTLQIQALVDAAPTAAGTPMLAVLIDPTGLQTFTVPLFDDGNNNDGIAGDGTWGNTSAHFFDASSIAGNWTLMVLAKDGSISLENTIYDGLLHIPSPGPADYTISQANYFNVDEKTFELRMPDIRINKTVATTWDPVNMGTDPFNLPGARVAYSITVGNHGNLPTDPNTIIISDTLPPETDLYVAGNLPPNTPVSFDDGGGTSGLTFNPATDLEIWTGGPVWVPWSTSSSIPAPDGNGCIPAIRQIRVTPGAVFNAASGGTTPQFTLTFEVRVR